MKNYEVQDSTIDGFRLIKLTEGKYSGIIYRYGKVDLLEDKKGTTRLKFEYHIVDNNNYVINYDELHNIMGDILHELIVEGLSKNELIYTGGVDENRTEDFNESNL
jgi:hypothetical protein